jgi:predicted transposase YdaD
MSRKPYDDAFKDLAEQDPEALLRLLDAFPPGATVTPLPREVSVQALLPDQPYEVNVAGHRHITHLEAQTYYPDDMPQREVDYSIRLWIKYRLPIYTYVLVFLPVGMPKEVPKSITTDAGDITVTVRFRVIGLWEIPAEKALGLRSAHLLPFVPLMNGGVEELTESMRVLANLTDETRRRELALHFVMIGGLRYNRVDLLEMLGRLDMVFPMEILKQSEMYKLIEEEATEKGLQKGLQQGLQEGRRTSLIHLLQRMVTRKFPSLSLERELSQVSSVEDLEKLCLDFGQYENEESLRQHLSALASTNSDPKTQ